LPQAAAGTDFLGLSGKVLKLTFMSRYFIGGAAAARAVTGLHTGTAILSGATTDAVTGCAYNPLKFS
jgi:hypothetical protein